MMVIHPVFEIGSIVYLKTDPDQLPMMVIGYAVYQKHIKYILATGSVESDFFDFELCESKSFY